MLILLQLVLIPFPLLQFYFNAFKQYSSIALGYQDRMGGGAGGGGGGGGVIAMPPPPPTPHDAPSLK